MSKHECCLRGFAHEGDPKGTVVKVAGVDTYVTYASGKSAVRAKNALIFATDVYGLDLINNKLLADKFAIEAGIDVYVPDSFDGKPAPAALITAPENERPSFDIMGWIKSIDMAAYKKMLENVVTELRTSYSKIGAFGFCFGAQGSVHLLSTNAKASVDFGGFGHPSLVNPDEIKEIRDVPTFFIFAEIDQMTPFEKAEEMKAILSARGKPESFHRSSFYKGVVHGFICRGKYSGEESNNIALKAHKEIIQFFSEQK